MWIHDGQRPCRVSLFTSVGSSDLLDLFRFHLPLCIILKYSSGAAQEKTYNYDADERTRRRMRNEPRIKLQDDNKDEHRDDCEATAAKDEKRENGGNGSYDNAEHDGNCGDERRMLKVLLGNKVMADETACAGLVVEKVLNPREQTGEQVDDCICNGSVACVLHALSE
jgi:hypothetical protein